MSHILFAETHRFDGYRILRATQKDQPNLIPPFIPSHGHGDFNMERNQILCWRSFSIHRLFKFHHTRRYVHVLSGLGIPATIQE